MQRKQLKNVNYRSCNSQRKVHGNVQSCPAWPTGRLPSFLLKEYQDSTHSLWDCISWQQALFYDGSQHKITPFWKTNVCFTVISAKTNPLFSKGWRGEGKALFCCSFPLLLPTSSLFLIPHPWLLLYLLGLISFSWCLKILYGSNLQAICCWLVSFHIAFSSLISGLACPSPLNPKR